MKLALLEEKDIKRQQFDVVHPKDGY